MATARAGSIVAPSPYTSREQVAMLGGPARGSQSRRSSMTRDPDLVCPRTRTRQGQSRDDARRDTRRSSSGLPSDVIWPAYLFTATSTPPSAYLRVTPLAPDPSTSPAPGSSSTSPPTSAGSGTLGPAGALPRRNGLSERATQERPGRPRRAIGGLASLLDARRTSSRPVHDEISSGSSVSRLPASMSFCSLVQRPMVGGSDPRLLSVRIIQRICGLRASG
mmetsp:Transcript_29952/g.84366  ORF Transcript_29952/g.84366 Transcript_29952/m.84366 type:complete len:221 (-) Transcript_29952:359-1021(-)